MAKLKLSFGHVLAFSVGTLFSIVWHFFFVPWSTGEFDPDFFNTAFEKSTTEDEYKGPSFSLMAAVIGNILIISVIHYIFKNYHDKRTWHQSLFLALWVATICLAITMQQSLQALYLFFSTIHTYILLIIIILIMHSFRNSHINGANCFQSQDTEQNEKNSSPNSGDEEVKGTENVSVSVGHPQTVSDALSNAQPEETSPGPAPERNVSRVPEQGRPVPEQCIVQMTYTGHLEKPPKNTGYELEMENIVYTPVPSTSQIEDGTSSSDENSVRYEPIPPPRRKRRWSDSTLGESKPLLVNM